MKVPNFQAQVQLQELPTVRQMINTADYHFPGATQTGFAAMADEAMQQLNQVVQHTAAEHLQQANAVRIQDARNQTQQFINARLYGQQGALNQQGADAFQAQANGQPLTENTLADLQQHMSSVTDSLGNDEQKQAYQQWAGSAKQQVAELLAQHEGQQFRVYQRGVGQATIASQQQTMALNYNNPDLLQSSVAAIQQASVDLAHLEAYPDQYGVVQGQKQAAVGLSAAIQQALLHQDDATAAKLLQQFAPIMDSDSLLDNTTLLRKAQNNKLALAIAGQVNSVDQADGVSKPSLLAVQSAALAHLPADAEPELKAQVLQAVSRQYHANVQAQHQQQTQAKANALQALLQNGGQYSALSGQLQAAIAPKDLPQVMAFASRLATNQPVKTDSALYYRLQNTPAKLKTTDLLALRDQLSDTDFKLLLDQQQQLQVGQVTDYQRGQEVLKQMLAESGINQHPVDNQAEKLLGRISAAFAEKLALAKQTSDKPLSQEMIQQIAARLFTRVGIEHDLFTPADKPAVLVDRQRDKVKVPAADRQQIIQALQTLHPGQPVNEESVFYSYLRHKGLLRY